MIIILTILVRKAPYLRKKMDVGSNSPQTEQPTVGNSRLLEKQIVLGLCMSFYF